VQAAVREDRAALDSTGAAVSGFAGLDLDRDAWDASTFSQNRRRRFARSGVLEMLFEETVERALREGLVSRHVSADGTLVRASASFKSFEPDRAPPWLEA
jgi:transposase